ncbi:cupin domain-containing protein [Bradyrhizobium iriomotense]|uniref:cupin domain-containing protein n=1 Tax=Bradyrhizobium iriomotense TaxID=441950 RepID=UPI001B8A0878|nr:cupin domain-containing protein [Bradyrhizobium iriomotense]MBR0784786.1 cupin domain-containing protein [Bradyrhizobium iriomotense]
MSTIKMRDIPVQKNSAPETNAQRAARYYNSGTAFQIEQSAVPPATFVDEAKRALDPDALTAVICCDSSSALGLKAPATAPNVLARYVVIRPGEQLELAAEASTMIFYCITGSGQIGDQEAILEWQTGDVFLMPGGKAICLRSRGDRNTVLWVVGDDPLVRFMDLNAKAPTNSSISPVHYPAKDIRRQIDLIYSAQQEPDTAGRAVIFSSDNHDKSRNIAPVLTLALNTLDPDTETRPHRHNSVAVMLVLEGESCRSSVDGNIKEWSKLSTTVTPPFAWHSHHNNGKVRAELLIVQDGGMFTHSRVNGFSFA